MEVHLNAAMSLDGKLSNRRREQVVISGERDLRRVDGLRRDSDAVMVGVGTVLADDPSLTCDGANPVRVVMDSRARTPADSAMLEQEGETVVAVGREASTERVEALREAGADVVETQGDRTDIRETLDYLESRGVGSVLVEGGGELNYSFIREGLVDRLTLYIGRQIMGGKDAPTLVDGEGFLEDYPEPTLVSVERIDDGVLLEYNF